ncbi:MAG: cache domain-containing protein [Rudaea sp.]
MTETAAKESHVIGQSYPKSKSLVVAFFLALVVALLPMLLYIAQEFYSPPLTPRVEAGRLAGEIDRLLQQRMTQTFTISAFPSIRAFAASLPPERSQRMAVAMNELQAWVAADDQVREVFVVDKAGNPIGATGTAMKSGWANRSFVQQALQGRLAASGIVHEQNEFSQYYSAPVLDNRREIAGALVLRVAAQELWGAVSAAGDPSLGRYAVLIDENGVRLADGGDAARNLTALGSLAVEVQTRILGEQTYGAQQTPMRWTNYGRAQELVAANNVGLIQASDLEVSALGVRRLDNRPWTVLYVAQGPVLTDILSRLFAPLAVALAGALVIGLWAKW